jgi:broad specificity phosphatase PhoE
MRAQVDMLLADLRQVHAQLVELADRIGLLEAELTAERIEIEGLLADSDTQPVGAEEIHRDVQKRVRRTSREWQRAGADDAVGPHTWATTSHRSPCWRCDP